MKTRGLHPMKSSADRFGYQIAARLSEASDGLPHDITERLRAARVRAVAQRAKEAPAVSRVRDAVVLSDGTAALRLGGSLDGFWNRLSSLLPLIALLAGLFLIVTVQDDIRAREVAELDAALLTDELPPSAYTDPGFVPFLVAKNSH